MRNHFYHCSALPLDVGSTIIQGNWGRIIKKFGWKHGAVFQELILEDVRLRSYPTYPSRLELAFACPTLEEMRRYSSINDSNGLNIIYRVSLRFPEKPTIIANCDMSRPKTMLDLKWAEEYWRSAVSTLDNPPQIANGIREIVTLSPLVIEERLE